MDNPKELHKKIVVVSGAPAEPPLGQLKYGYIITNCNSCWAAIDDRLKICPQCGKKAF